MGISQGIDDMIPEIKKAAELDNTFFLLLGSGTEYEKVKNSLDGYLQKVKVVPAIDQSEFFELCCEADVGMIFLFKDYRVPNIPGKFTTYLNAGLPILAAVDKTTDAGIILEKNNCGYSCLNGDVDKFVGLVEKMRDSKELRMQMSKNAKKLFEKEYSVEVCGNKILAHFNR